jgi:hypothetical protein
MDIEAAVETCLRQYSPIRGKDLKAKLEQRGYTLSRSQFFRYGVKLKKADKLEQINGIWHWRQDVKSKLTRLWEPAPKVEFEITQQRGFSKVQLPTVATNLVNRCSYQLGIRLKVWTLLGGRNLGLINDIKGYYTGKTLILAEPDGGGFGNGCFSVPPECVNSNEELSLSFVATLFDRNNPDKAPYKIQGSYTHRRKLNDWFYEPAIFSDETEFPSMSENWDSLLSDFSKVGANLMKVTVEKHASGNKAVIQGIIVLRDAKETQDVLKKYVSGGCEAFLFTKAPLDKDDRFNWQGVGTFVVKEIEDIYDVSSFSYRIVKLGRVFAYYPAFVTG